MSKIVDFPKSPPQAEAPPEWQRKPRRNHIRMRRLGRVLATVLWVVFATVWRFVGWIVALDVAWQFGQMFYYWDSQGIAAGFDFALHFTVFCVLSYYVANGCPDDADR